MAANSRPPSEQGVEYDLLDELRELRPLLEQLRDRPPVAEIKVSGDWFDRVPRDFLGPDYRHGSFQWSWPMTPSGMGGRIMVTTYPDRVELQLRTMEGMPIWQRTLFYEDAQIA